MRKIFAIDGKHGCAIVLSQSNTVLIFEEKLLYLCWLSEVGGLQVSDQKSGHNGQCSCGPGEDGCAFYICHINPPADYLLNL